MTLLTAAAFLVLASQAQLPREPAKDLFLRSAKAPGVEIRFVDYHWHKALFDAMASGKGDVPEAKRNWVVVRMILDTRPMTLEGKRLPVGNFGIALWPNLDGKGMQVEVRQVDMRDVFPNINAMGPVPRGETMYKGPVRFETESPVAERLDTQAAEADGAVVITVRYGDRRFSLKLTP
jgi:hypothetical protein